MGGGRWVGGERGEEEEEEEECPALGGDSSNIRATSVGGWVGGFEEEEEEEVRGWGGLYWVGGWVGGWVE